MNKIFRLVWNRELKALVVASEFAQGDSASSCTVGSVTRGASMHSLAIALMIGLGGLMSPAAWAGNTVYFNDGSDAGCETINDLGSQSGFVPIDNAALCGTGDKSTQNTRALFYSNVGTGPGNGSNSLSLAGELFVNSGRLGLGGANNGIMRIGSLFTLDATPRGARSLAIGSGSTAATATLAGGADAIAVGTAASASGANAVVIGLNANANTLNAVALGNSASVTGPTLNMSNTEGVSIGRNARSGTTGTGGDGVAIGGGSNAMSTGSSSPVAIGWSANAQGSGSQVAIGDQARATGTNSVAIGGNPGVAGTTATGNYALAIGPATAAAGNNTIAMGRNANAAGLDAIAIGGNATGGAQASAAASVAIGAQSVSNVANGVAIGQGAQVTNANAVALGTGSVTAAANATPSGTINGVTYTYAGGAPTSVVSVGAVGVERQVTNVAAGRVSATSTDAINGSQLYAADQAITAVDDKVDVLGGDVATHLGGGSTYDPTTGAMTAPTYSVGGTDYFNVGDALGAQDTIVTALGNSTAGSLGGTSAYDPTTGTVTAGLQVGGNTYTTVNEALQAVETVAGAGWNVTANGAGSTVANIGPNGQVTFNGDSNITVTQNGADDAGQVNVTLNRNLDLDSVAVGNTTITSGGMTIVGGPNGPVSLTNTGLDNGGNRIINVGDGTDPSDAVNLSQLENAVAGATTHYYSVNDNGVATGNYNNDGATGINAIAAGTNASAAGNRGVAVGDGANAAGIYGTAIGPGATVANTSNGGAVAIGLGAISSGGNSPVAIGKSSLSSGSSAVAMGDWSTASGDRAIAIGGQPSGTHTAGGSTFASGQQSVAIGNLAQSTAQNALALGTNANAGQAGAVALGSGSTTAAAVATTDATVGGITYGGFAGTAPTSTVSVGNAGTERTVTNVAAGRIQPTSTDAINGSQLYATHVAIGNMATSIANNFGGGVVVNPDGSLSAPTYVVGGNTYNNVGDALQAVIVGGANQTKYYSVNSTGGGNEANDGATGADAIAIGKDAVAADNGAVALGAGSVTAAAVGTAGITIAGNNYTFAGATPTSTVSVGAAGAERTITNVAAGRIDATSTDAINGSQLHATNQAVEAIDGRVTNIETNIDAINGDLTNLTNRVSTVEGDVTNIKNGSEGMFQVSQDNNTPPPAPTGANSAAGGAGAVASGDNSTALGNGSNASGNNSVALGNGSVATEDNTVSVGAVGEERRVTNVAAGVNGTDAVNVDQLKGVVAGGVQYDKNADGSNNYNSLTLNPDGNGPTVIHNVGAGVAPNDAVNVAQLQNTLQQANAYTDSRLQGLQNDLWTLDRGYRGATASAMAMAGLPQAYLPGKSMLAVGAGGYQGEYGMAVGLSGITENGRYVYKAQASGNTTRDWGFSVGAGIQW